MQVKRVYSALLLPIALLACSRREPIKQDRGQVADREMDSLRSKGSTEPMGTSAAVASAEQRATMEGNRVENMGRNFEGRLHMRVTGLREPLELRYLSRGERGRLQIDRPGKGSEAFDAIFAGDQVLVLDHVKRGYRARDLDDVPKKAEPSDDVRVERKTDQRDISGLLCYPWRMRSGGQTIDACVSALPGPFDTDKLETVSGMDVPSWVEKLIGDRHLPIAASVSENGRELYKLELLQYSPAEVPENELTVPANYRRL